MQVNLAPAARRAALLGTALVLVTACQREEVTHSRVPKAATASPSPSPSPSPPATATATATPPPTGTASGKVAWTLPAGWTQEVAGGMRFATLRPSVTGRIDASVVVLPGPAGGELANVNRWRGQIGLAPGDEPALAAARRTVKTGLGPARLYDFASDGTPRSRLVVALAEVEGSTWFVKLTGDAEPVGAATPDFLRLVESLRRAPN